MFLIPTQLVQGGFEFSEKICQKRVRLLSTNLLMKTQKLYQQRLQNFRVLETDTGI